MARLRVLAIVLAVAQCVRDDVGRSPQEPLQQDPTPAARPALRRMQGLKGEDFEKAMRTPFEPALAAGLTIQPGSFMQVQLPENMVFIHKTTWLRQHPNDDSEFHNATVRKDESVQILSADENGFVEIRITDGTKGWVRRKYLREAQPIASVGHGPTQFPALPREWTWPVQKVAWDKLLGQGAFGRVFRTKVLCTKEAKVVGTDEDYVAVKVVNNTEKAKEELEPLRAMSGRSDFVVSLVGAPDTVEVEKEQKLYLMQDYLNSGELWDFVVKYFDFKTQSYHRAPPPLNNVTVQLALVYQMLLGTNAIHQAGWIHMDLKLENIMLNCRNGKCYASVIDLGLACRTGNCSLRGTPGCVAPEVTEPSAPGHDVWSMGVVLYAFFLGHQPPYVDYEGDPLEQVWAYNVDRDPHLGAFMQKTNHSAFIGETIQRMLQRRVAKRATLPWVLSRIEETLRLSTFGTELIDMVPSRDGAMFLRPSCLYEKHPEDIGSQRARRNDCIDTPAPVEGVMRCGVCFGCNPCCKCRVLRNGVETKAYMRLPMCT